MGRGTPVLQPSARRGTSKAAKSLKGGCMQSRTWLVLALVLGTVVALPSASLAASFKVIHTFSGATDGVIPDGTMIFDAAGNLYGTTVGGGLYGGGTVFELSPDGSGNWTETIL